MRQLIDQWQQNVGISLIFLGFLAGLFWILLKIRSWMRDDTDSTVQSSDLLEQYREMRDRGELSDEEFRLIKSRLLAPLTGQAGGTVAPGGLPVIPLPPAAPPPGGETWGEPGDGAD